MYALIFFGIVALVACAVAWMIRRARIEYRAEAEAIAKINRMPMDEAKRAADLLLNDGRTFRCTEAAGESEKIAPLAIGLQDLFKRFSKIETPDGLVVLDRDMIDQSECSSDYVVIGRGSVGTDSEFKVAARGAAEPIFEIYGSEEIDAEFGTYASVYHWLITVAREAEL